jgi:hypothetical protein
MKYIKTYEISEENHTRLYWSVPNEKYYFFAGLKKIGCPKEEIERLWDAVNEVTSKYKFIERYFIGFKSESDFWSLMPYSTPIEDNSNFFHKYGYEYQGPIKLTREELQQIQLEREVDKYNL